MCRFPRLFSWPIVELKRSIPISSLGDPFAYSLRYEGFLLRVPFRTAEDGPVNEKCVNSPRYDTFHLWTVLELIHIYCTVSNCSSMFFKNKFYDFCVKKLFETFLWFFSYFLCWLCVFLFFKLLFHLFLSGLIDWTCGWPEMIQLCQCTIMKIREARRFGG